MTQEKRLLILGGSGFVGARTAQQALKSGWQVAITYNQRPIKLENCEAYQLDLSSEAAQLAKILAEFAPQTVINSSVPNIGVSATADDHFTISVGGVEKLLTALRASRQAPRLLQISTNAVFDGFKGMYSEDDAVTSANRHDSFSAYGTSKAEAEQKVLAAWQNSAVVRTSLVWGRDWAGQLNRRTQFEIVEPLREGRKFRRFRDRYITPTLVDSLAAALIELLETTFTGIIHVAGRQRLTDVEFAAAIANGLQLDPALIEPESRPTTMPGDITLAVKLAQTLLKTPMLNVEEQLALVFPGGA